MRYKVLIKTFLGFPRLLWHFFRKNRFGVGVVVEGNVFMSNCSVGKYAYIGKDCVINYSKIGNYCSIAPGVQIGGMEHNYSDMSTCVHLNLKQHYGVQTIIEEDVWIGAGAIIKQGIKIGRGAVIGANSFVTKDVQPYSIWFGTPARFYKMRFDASKITLLEESHYWQKKPRFAKNILMSLKDEFCK